MHKLTELSSGNWSQYSNITIIPKTSWIKVLRRFWINYLSKRAYFYDSFVLPYLGNISLGLRTRLRQTTERDLRYCKLKVIFRSKCRLNTLFWSKDSLEKKIALEQFTVIPEKPSATFRPEWLYTGFPILQENALQNVKGSAIPDPLLQCRWL